MLNFCTLFDSNYLSRGVAMYESLKKHCADFHLYIFAFDDKCYEILKKLGLERATIISLNELEDEDLLSVKPVRSKVEYCWTCTPSTILYIIQKYNVDVCTYLDADTYFYSSPAPLIDELRDDSVIITEHRYTPEYDNTKTSGKYCVQFMTFKNDDRGLEVLKWWRAACIDSCELNPEQGKCGDQKYLDDWTQRFTGVHELQHLGGGVAPWNIQQYDLRKKRDKLWGREKKSGKEFDLIFYHYHSLKFFQDETVELTGGYKLSSKVRSFLYMPYIKRLKDLKNRILEIGVNFDPNGALPPRAEEPTTLVRRGIRFLLRSLSMEEDKRQLYKVINI